MNIHEKITQLLQIARKESNHEAIQLMMRQQGMSFFDAFQRLNYSIIEVRQLSLFLADIQLRYTYDHDLMPDFYYIQREVLLDRKVQQEWTQNIYEDTHSYGGIPPLNLPTVPEIMQDRQTISPAIENLYHALKITS